MLGCLFSSVPRDDPARLFGERRNFRPVDRGLGVIIKVRLTVQRAFPVPIEGHGASAALRNGVRAAGRVLRRLHTQRTASAAIAVCFGFEPHQRPVIALQSLAHGSERRPERFIPLSFLFWRDSIRQCYPP